MPRLPKGKSGTWQVGNQVCSDLQVPAVLNMAWVQTGLSRHGKPGIRQVYNKAFSDYPVVAQRHSSYVNRHAYAARWRHWENAGI